ncbi:MAG TPA: amphi-Trp domain-containing protein [Actinomycetaceae bacterium]|nr:amphi-Trp domain-containing protein [Actinomycetaceae bacterium]
MVGKVLLKAKSALTRDELADLLIGLADKIQNGRVTLSDGANTVDMQLPESLKVDIEVEDDVKPARIKRQLEIEIEWRVDEAGQPALDQGGSAGLTIS